MKAGKNEHRSRRITVMKRASQHAMNNRQLREHQKVKHHFSFMFLDFVYIAKI